MAAAKLAPADVSAERGLATAVLRLCDELRAEAPAAGLRLEDARGAPGVWKAAGRGASSST
jgi:hypothetical protein